MVAKDEQNIYDLCISSTGDINNLFEFVRLNIFDIDSTIVSGQKFSIPGTIQQKESYAITNNIEIFKNTKRISENQNIFDVTCMYFGSIEYLFTVLQDNNLSISDRLIGGESLLINNKSLGNETIKKRVVKENWFFNNYQSQSMQEVTLGDYNNDYNNDYF
jgi:hypothetical protein